MATHGLNDTAWGAVSPIATAVQEAAEAGAGRSRGFKKSFSVDAAEGNDSGSGSWRSPLKTIAAAVALVQSGDQLILSGKFREQVIPSNLLGYLSFIGDARQSAYGDDPWKAGAAWLAPASPTAAKALLTARGQGYYLENLLMDGPADAAAVELERNALSGNSEYDASHIKMLGCRFVGGQSGIEIDGGVYRLWVQDCTFHANTNGIKGLNTSVDVSTAARIIGNQFYGSHTNEIILSLNDSIIKGNIFHDLGPTEHINTIYNSGQGARNHVIHNYFPETNANIKEDDGYKGSTTDYWRNFATGTAAEVVESPPGAS